MMDFPLIAEIGILRNMNLLFNCNKYTSMDNSKGYSIVIILNKEKIVKVY